MQCACAILSSGLPGSTTFFHILVTGKIFGEKRKEKVLEHKM
jgi:hypothetical protein